MTPNIAFLLCARLCYQRPSALKKKPLGKCAEKIAPTETADNEVRYSDRAKRIFMGLSESWRRKPSSAP